MRQKPGARHAYRIPPALRDALAATFERSPDAIDAVRIVQQSHFARLHGRRVAATTRRNAIYVAGSGRRFAADPELVLHEYFHVLCQWNTGALTTWRYVVESLKHGYRGNRFEVEARAFTRAHVLAFAAGLRDQRVAPGDERRSDAAALVAASDQTSRTGAE